MVKHAPVAGFCRSLQGRFLAALAVTGLVPLLVLLTALAVMYQRALVQQAEGELQGRARDLAERMDADLARAMTDVATIAGLPEVVSMEPDRQVPVLQALFERTQFARLSAFDLAGDRIASSHPSGARSVAERPSFQTAAQLGRQASQVAAALSTGRPSLLIHTPIRDGDGRVVGVLGGVVDLADRSSFLKNLSSPTQGVGFVLDQSGHLLLHPDPGMLMERRDYAWAGVPPGRPPGPGVVAYAGEDGRLLAGYTPLTSMSWVAVVERPESAVLAPAQRAWHISLLTVAVAIALAAGVAICLARWLTRPLRQLAAAVHSFGSPQASILPDPGLLPLPTSSVGEIAELTAVFQAMRVRRVEMEEALAHQALHDALTLLPNRALFQQRLDQAGATALRDGSGFAVFIIDLDGFKDVNDSLGHDAGDSVLQQVALRFSTAVRDGDTLARLGGDEFAVLAPGMDNEADAGRAATRLLQALKDPILRGGRYVSIGASIGIALHPTHASTSTELMRFADMAMYTAKAGRTGHATFLPGQELKNAHRLALSEELGQAIGGGQLFLHYQPVVELRTMRVVHFEALARWNHPKRGLLPPSDFIPLAETTGLMPNLTNWALGTALVQLAGWTSAGLDISVAVNISPRDLQDAGLPHRLDAMLKRWGVDPVRLTLEVTEDGIASSLERTERVRSQLKAMGVTLSVDDFGSGNASFGYLRLLRPGEIKIDRSFTRSAAADTQEGALVRAMIEVGKALGAKVVAEGVEAEETLTYLIANGCDTGQGHLFSPPVPPEQVATVIQRIKARGAALAVA